MADDPKVVNLAEVSREPYPEMIECLKGLLAKAERGEIRTLVYISREYSGEFKSGTVGELSNRDYVLGTITRMGLDYYMRRRRADGVDEPK